MRTSTCVASPFILALLWACAPSRAVVVDEPQLSADVVRPGPPEDTAPDEDSGRGDGDGDGYGEGDCVDTNPDIHPGAAEVCDGVDNDCDGTIDANATDAVAWYLDLDQDLYGDNAQTTAACWKPTGYTAFTDDCDDTRADVYPGAPEACDGVDNNCTGDETDAVDAGYWFGDNDGDGYGFSPRRACGADPGLVTAGGDCADGDAARHPGADEWCNGWDDDCDGETDEAALDALTFYADADGDTFGAAGDPIDACTAPAGFVADATDCDDADAAIGGPIAWYTDADGDGYGDAALLACVAPPGAVAWGGDCDDADPAAFPGAPEVCDTEVDLDCDGLVGTADADGDTLRACDDCDDADPLVGGPGTWYADRDGDTYGDASQSIEACVAPLGFVADSSDCNDGSSVAHPGASEVWYDDEDEDCLGGDDWDADLDGFAANVDDCVDTDAAVHPGATEVCANHLDDDCDGTDNGCAASGDVSLGAVDYTLETGTAEEAQFGYAWSAAIDYFGAGDSAIVVSAEWDDSGAGAVYVGAFSELPTAGAAPTWRAVWQGENPLDYAGTALSLPGDFDGDGVLDVAVGAPSSAGPGAVYLIPLDATGAQSLKAAPQQMLGSRFNSRLGSSLVEIDDLDGNGADELVVGDNGASVVPGGGGRGCAYYFEGPLTSALTARTGQLCGDEDAVLWAGSIAVVDTQGDGLPELISSSSNATIEKVSVGKAAFLELPFTGAVEADDVDFYLYGVSAERSVDSVGGAGDINGDGYPDVYTGGPDDTASASQAGSIHLYLGPLSATRTVDEADFVVSGTVEDENLAIAASAGDTNADGWDDLVMGERSFSYTAPGRAGLFYGPILASATLDEADVVFGGEEAGDLAGGSFLGPGDLNGDGFGDLLIGASNFGSAHEGRGYVWLGTGG